VRYADSDAMGVIADSVGRFRTTNLEPGAYRFVITHEGYRDEECEAIVPENAPGAQPAAPAPGHTDGKESSAAVAPKPEGKTENIVVPLKCALQALPKVAVISGTVRDAESTEFVEGAAISILDPRSRSLTLETDQRGAFRFENVPAGSSTITLEAEGYLRATTVVDLEPRKDVTAQLMLNPRPKTPNVVVTANELLLREQVHFLRDSAEILPDSLSLIEEIGDVLRQRPDIAEVEIQGHTDDSGTPEYNMNLSSQRANAVRDALIQNGVEASRLTARGYGQEKPLLANTNDRNRAKNRRVQLVITKK
jgi:outer membrane protein OmpA-like peptidoglycan-associated protein